MLSLFTRDDWAFSLDVTVAGNTETFTNAAADASAYAALEALVAWLNDAGRAWTGLRTWSWSWARDENSGGAIVTLTATGGTFEIDNGALGRLKLPTDIAAEIVGEDPADGTWAPPRGIGVRGWLPWLSEPGDAGGAGAVRPGVPGLAGARPHVEAAGTPVDAARLTEVLAAASSPRRGWLWQQSQASWRLVSVGPVSRSKPQVDRYAWTLDVAETQ